MKDNTLALGSLDNYLIIDKLEKGGYSTVYKVKHEKTNKLFAAKVVERYCKNEIEMNKKLSETQSPFINKYIIGFNISMTYSIIMNYFYSLEYFIKNNFITR